MLRKIRKLVYNSSFLRQALYFYHYLYTVYGNIIYRYPSKKIIVIGLVGSKGKTTTANILWQLLNNDQGDCGLIGTANIRYGNTEIMNPYHMTMPGRWFTQKILRKIVDSGCKYVVMEVPSEAIIQNRHKGIHFDILIYTNVTEEILASHQNSFDKLLAENAKLFKYFSSLSDKKIKNGEDVSIFKKAFYYNSDDQYIKRIIANIDPSIHQKAFYFSDKSFFNITSSDITGSKFSYLKDTYYLPMLGDYNCFNALAAIVTAKDYFKYLAKDIYTKLSSLPIIPGRMEVINTNKLFSVIVDYAHEPIGLGLLVHALQKLKKHSGRVIILIGAEGGGRDKKKRPIMGSIVSACDMVIITNVDPYDDDPLEIIADIAKGSIQAGMITDKNLLLIPDRKSAIKTAIDMADKDDIICVTGKGAEQSMVIGSNTIKWDDREVIRELL